MTLAANDYLDSRFAEQIGVIDGDDVIGDIERIQVAQAVIKLIALILNVAMNFLLDPRFGAAGAAMANGISYGTAATILLVAFVRESGLGVRETLWIRRADIDDLLRAARRVAGRMPGLPARS